MAPRVPPTPTDRTCGPTVFREAKPANAPPLPRVGLDLEAISETILGMPPITVASSPFQAPPWRATDLPLRFRAVVNVPLAADALANEGGIMLAQAEALELGVAVPVFTPVLVGGVMVIGSFTVSPKQEGRLARMRVNAQGQDALRAIRVTVRASGLPVVREIDWSPASDQPTDQPIYVELKPRQILEIMIKNLDPHSAALVEVALDGWVWDVQHQDDAIKSTLVRQDQAATEAWGVEPIDQET